MNTPFTMSYAQFLDFTAKFDLSWHDFQKVNELPKGVELEAIAGVWGSYQDIRCLFVDGNRNGYRCVIKGSSGRYLIKELDINAKSICMGERFIIM